MSHEHEHKHISPRARRREEAKRRTRIAVPFFAVLFALTIVAFILPLRPTESASEKRKLTEFPAFSVDTLLSGEYFDGIGNISQSSSIRRMSFASAVGSFTQSLRSALGGAS